MKNSIKLRHLAPLFRGPFLRKIAVGRYHSELVERLNPNKLEWLLGKPLHEIFDTVYGMLLTDYRCEYIFKNLLTHLFLANQTCHEAIHITDEFRVGKSRVDLAVFSDVSVAYEIKTEFDSSFRLASQTNEYVKLFDQVYVVTTGKLRRKMQSVTPGTVGILELSDTGDFVTIRESDSHSHFTDLNIAFDCLRQKERLVIAEAVSNGAIHAPSSELYVECKKRFRRLLPFEVQQLMLQQLRTRHNGEASKTLVAEVPSSLKHSAVTLRATRREIDSIKLELKTSQTNNTQHPNEKMPTYFPFLRGKQQEMLALRQLKQRLSMESSVRPIIELVNSNSTTQISLDAFAESMMKFVLVTNPKHGEFEGREQDFYNEFVLRGPLQGYERYIPAIYVYRDTTMREVKQFLKNYDSCPFRAVIYNGEPASDEVRTWCSSDGRLYYHMLPEGSVTAEFTSSVPQVRRVILQDNFKRQIRNADYPTVPELFTDMTTQLGNISNQDWGDYSIVGDYYTEGGGQAMAVAIHHIHYAETTRALNVSHFLSDRQETTADTPGKTIEAVDNLVSALDAYEPNFTVACEEYRRMSMERDTSGLAYLKRLSILHHLELMLDHEQ